MHTGGGGQCQSVVAYLSDLTDHFRCGHVRRFVRFFGGEFLARIEIVTGRAQIHKVPRRSVRRSDHSLTVNLNLNIVVIVTVTITVPPAPIRMVEGMSSANDNSSRFQSRRRSATNWRMIHSRR